MPIFVPQEYLEKSAAQAATKAMAYRKEYLRSLAEKDVSAMRFLKASEMERGMWNGGNDLGMAWPIVHEADGFSVWFVAGWDAYVLNASPSGTARYSFATLAEAIAAGGGNA